PGRRQRHEQDARRHGASLHPARGRRMWRQSKPCRGVARHRPGHSLSQAEKIWLDENSGGDAMMVLAFQFSGFSDSALRTETRELRTPHEAAASLADRKYR